MDDSPAMPLPLSMSLLLSGDPMFAYEIKLGAIKDIILAFTSYEKNIRDHTYNKVRNNLNSLKLQKKLEIINFVAGIYVELNIIKSDCI